MCFLRGVCALLEIYCFLSFAEIVYHIIPTLSIGIIEKNTRTPIFLFLHFSLPFVFFAFFRFFSAVFPFVIFFPVSAAFYFSVYFSLPLVCRKLSAFCFSLPFIRRKFPIFYCSASSRTFRLP
jgi:hypothetical protein